MGRTLFYNALMQEQFQRNGYVVVDLMTPLEAEALETLYDQLEGAKGTANTNKNTYELSFFEKDVARKREKFNRIYQFMEKHLNRVLVNYKPFIINLFNKHTGTGEVPVHQNWTFVDEERYTSVSVWCPLLPVSRQNGTLEVVPGSHKVICNYRGPSIPWVFDHLNDKLKQTYMVPLQLSPGQVAILDDSLIHYSGVNLTDKPRKAIQLIMKPAEAPLIHCYQADEPGYIHIMDVSDDYFFDFDMWQKPLPSGQANTIAVNLQKLTEAELLERCNHNLKPSTA